MRPCPTATSVPTIERTIWWQNAFASIWKAHIRSSPGDDDQLVDSTRRMIGADPPCGTPAEGGEVVLAQQGVGTDAHCGEIERARHVP